VLFDVPTGAYRLRLADDSDPDNEKTALVDIPLQFTPSLPRPEPGGTPGR
jgi:hypothetical protein